MRSQVPNRVQLRTSVWYGDEPLTLDFPDAWNVRIERPNFGHLLSTEEMWSALQHPVNQAPIRDLARGKSRPLILVDDLTRPTPADQIVPLILRELDAAGIRAESVTILMASGAHGPAPLTAVAKKVGEEAARRCRLVSHDFRRGTVRIGRTALGTPVLVNRELLRSDCTIGIGGIYPQGATWLGGGTKLALGVLGGESVFALHYEHSPGGFHAANSPFRTDLDEIARLIGLNTVVMVHIDENRNVIRMRSGDPIALYPDSAAYTRRVFRADPPGDADVVVSNAYPMDISLTFARSKGMTPFAGAAPATTRVLIASCPEGLGLHPMFPMAGTSPWDRRIALVRHLARTHPGRLASMVVRTGLNALERLRRSGRKAGVPPAMAEKRPILYRPAMQGLPSLHGAPMAVMDNWPQVIERILDEHGPDQALRVRVYPCAPLQIVTAEEPEVAEPAKS